MEHISHLHQLETLNLQNNWLTTAGKHSNTIKISCRNLAYSGRAYYRPVVYKVVLCGANGSVEFLFVLLSCGSLLTGSVKFGAMLVRSVGCYMVIYDLYLWNKGFSNTPKHGRGNAVSSLTLPSTQCLLSVNS